MFKNALQKKLRERFFVTPKTGVHFSGVLIAEDKTYAVFADVKAHPEGTEPADVPDDVYIRHDNIAYVQLKKHADG